MTTETLFFDSAIELIGRSSPEVAVQIKNELQAQKSRLKLIASENYNSLPVLAASASLTMDKYSEGNVGKRYYSGCEQVDVIEQLAVDYAKELFGAEYAYVQPHSGSDANLIAYYALTKFLSLDRKPRLLSMSVDCGGHLTHSNPLNIVNTIFDVYTYETEDDGWLSYDTIRSKALEVKPDVILAGYSAYPRKLDFSKFKEVADEVGAILMCDMAHFAGLVAGKVFTGVYNPIPYCDIVTSTTQKTLRAGRGGLILSKEKYAEFISRGCPYATGGPLNNMIAAKAVGLAEALTPKFQEYAQQVVKNANELASCLKKLGMKILTDGTDNHMVLIDLRGSELNGRQAENALLDCGIVTNRNSLKNDPNGAWYTSAIRIGVPALTTRGMKEEQMSKIASLIFNVLSYTKPKGKAGFVINPLVKEFVSETIKKMLDGFPLYPELKM